MVYFSKCSIEMNKKKITTTFHVMLMFFMDYIFNEKKTTFELLLSHGELNQHAALIAIVLYIHEIYRKG
jgi:hypothetical protein